MATTAYDELFRQYGELYDINPFLLKAQAIAESNLNPLAVSPRGAQGIAQFMPETYREWAKKLGYAHPNPFDPQQAIHVQAAYMAWLQQQTDGSVEATLAAYNWGVGHMERLTDSLSNPETWLHHVPASTRQYIAKILSQLVRWAG